MKIRYDSNLKALSRDLRTRSTLTEVLLWNQLKQRRMLGYQFMRQKPIGHYVVDFYCSRLGLAIEIDGDSHRQKYERDIKRQSDLEGLGVCFLRFHDHDVKRDISNVLRVIQNWIEQREKSCPDSRRKEGRR